MMRAVLILAVLSLAPPAMAQIRCSEDMDAPLDRSATSSMSGPEFVREVAAKERAFARALPTFGYTAEMLVQTLDGDKVDGEFRETLTYAYAPDHVRRATVHAGAVNTLHRIKLSSKDIDGLLDSLPFSLTPDVIVDRDIVYSGRQRLNAHNTSVFDVLLRDRQALPRGFAGRVWVQTDEDVIVKTCGRSLALPIAPMRYEVVRQWVPGDYWLPARVRANEAIKIGEATVHVRLEVKYSDFKPKH